MKTTLLHLTIIMIVFMINPIKNSRAQNSALEFDGQNDYISIGKVDLPIDTAFTIMSWVKWNINPGTGNKWANIFTCNSDTYGDQGRFWLQHNSNNSKFEFAIKTDRGRRYLFSNTSTAQDVWVHVAATFNGNQIKIFINGIEENAISFTGTIDPHRADYETTLGQWACPSHNYRRFNGAIDEASIWSRALSEAEIAGYMYNIIPAGSPCLIAYYRMNPGDSTLIDYSGNGYNGEITGATDVESNIEIETTIEASTYDDFENAFNITYLINDTSENAQFTNEEATPDGIAGSEWNSNPDANVWFKFKATTSNMKVFIDRGDEKGTIKRINAAIWDGDSVTEIVSKRYIQNDDDLTIETVGTLIPGEWYYISVDSKNVNKAGTFTLSLSDDDISYDFYEGAIDVSHLINDTSENAQFTTAGATSDQNPASEWNTNPDYNVWFKFQATTQNIKVLVDRGDEKGTIKRINAAIWESDGTTEIASKRYVNNEDDLTVEAVGLLTVGNWYYISVDNHYKSNRGSFTLCLYDNDVSYDFFEGAIDISYLINDTSENAQFTTVGASGDLNPASAWNTDPDYNVWFKFQATTNHMKVLVDRGDENGTIKRINAAIWESDGTTEIASKRYVNNEDDVTVEAVGLLTIGDWYYVSVDNHYKSHRGSFTLCLYDNDVSYDFYEGAIDVSHLINDTSEIAQFTTVGASGDKNAASAWNTNPDYNVWFKFQATTKNMKVLVDRGDEKGTIQRINAAIWESDGTTEIASKRYVNNEDDVIVEAVGLLTVGDWYYISVDNHYKSNRGTFTLILSDNDISYDFYEGALDVSIIINSCSEDAIYSTSGASGDKLAASNWNTNPDYNVWFKFQATTQSINVAIDRGDEKGTIKRVNLAIWEPDGTTEIASIRYSNDTDDIELTVEDTLTIGAWYYISVDNNYKSNRGTFTLCLNDLSLGENCFRSNGSGGGYWTDPSTWANSVIPPENSNIFVDINDELILDTNVVVNRMTVYGTLSIKSGISSYNFDVNGDISNTGNLNLENTVISLTGTNDQSISGTFKKIKVDKTSGSLKLTEELTISNSIDLTNGNLVLGEYDLHIENTSDVAILNGSENSYIQADSAGKIFKDVAVGKNLFFPVGDNDEYSPFSFILNSGSLNAASISLNLRDNKHSELEAVNYLTRYWTLESQGISDPDYSVSYVYTDADIVGNEEELIPTKYHADWLLGEIQANANNNTLTWNNITSFSDFTGGDLGTLPIELVSFGAEPVLNYVKLNWITSAEINNDFFTIEKSTDGYFFEIVDYLPGAGNSSSLLSYELIDTNPVKGISYYRLKQTDYDGKFEYSDIVAVEYEMDQMSNPNLSIYPNPVKSNSSFTTHVKDFVPNTSFSIELRNNIGNLVNLHSEVTSDNGSARIQIDTHNLVIGIYYIIICYHDHVITKKVIIN